MIIQSNKISIDFKDADYVKNADASVQNAREGSVSRVGIEYTKDCTVQKEMGKGIVYDGTQESAGVNELVNELQKKEMNPADFISRSMTGEDAAGVEEDGTILEEYVASSLERAVDRVKNQRRERQESVEAQVQDGAKEKEHFEEMEQRILEASQMAAQVQGMSQVAAKYFLENNVAFTPEGIQGSSGVSSTYSDATAPDSFDALKEQIVKILVQDGLEVTDENVEIARWLYEKELPVTGENIGRYETLEALKELSSEKLAERIADEVWDGIRPEAADISHISRNEAAQKRDALLQVSDEDLQQLFSTDTEQITAKRQLEEIRLMMTIDAARTMENKGIHLDVKNLIQIVEELRGMELENSKEILQELGVEPTEEAVSLAAQTLRAAEDVLAAPVTVYGTTIAMGDRTTIGEVAQEGNLQRLAMEPLSDVYEKVGTEVRKDLGDSMTKAFTNVDDILTDMGLDTTGANQRAVRILAYNQMALTKENIQTMKAYDDQVTTLAKSLRPPVVAELIRRDANPMEMSIDELSDVVTEITEEVTQEDISLRKYLWKLDHAGDITEDQRKTMIGIYRLLDKVEKSDGAVVGQVVKEGRELSFSSLLSAVRTRKAEGLDRQVDDEFGGLEQVVSAGESISSQIDAAFASRIVTKLQQTVSPAVLKEREETYMSDSLEVVLDECVNSEAAQLETRSYYAEVAAEIREMAAQSDEQITAYLQQLDIPDSLVNVQLMRQYLDQGSRAYVKQYTKEESERIVQALDEPEELQQVFDEMDELHRGELEKQKHSEDLRYEDVRDIARMAGSISFYRQMRQYQKFEVPVVTEEGVTACSVTVRQGKESEKGTVEISVDSIQMGQVQATFKVNGNRVSGFVTSDEGGKQTEASKILSEFEKDLEMSGFTMERGDVVKGKRNSFHLGDKIEETATNDQLYQVAKLFIQNVQRHENQNGGSV